jgi:hypothetical protein
MNRPGCFGNERSRAASLPAADLGAQVGSPSLLQSAGFGFFWSQAMTSAGCLSVGKTG